MEVGNPAQYQVGGGVSEEEEESLNVRATMLSKDVGRREGKIRLP